MMYVEVGASQNKTHANLVVAAFITNTVGMEENKDGNQQTNKQVDSSAITWEAFRDTIKQWIITYGPDFTQTVAD